METISPERKLSSMIDIAETTLKVHGDGWNHPSLGADQMFGDFQSYSINESFFCLGLFYAGRPIRNDMRGAKAKSAE